MRLICVGDSWTAGHGVDEDIRYKEWAVPNLGCNFIPKLRNANGWPRWLANTLDCVYVNFSECGRGNHKSLEEIKKIIEDKMLKHSDIIIVMFSYPYRDDISPIETYEKFEKLLKPYVHFYLNAFYPMFKNEENFDTKNLPNYYINPNGSVCDILKEYEIENDIGVWEYNSRRVWKDKKGLHEGDYHPNLKGYKVIADYIYNNIKDVYIPMIENNPILDKNII
jgi:hypothetical protein